MTFAYGAKTLPSINGPVAGHFPKCALEPRLDLRLEHVPDHRAQFAVEPLEEHLMCQLLRPQVRFAHSAVELLPKDPFPVVGDEFCEVLGEIRIFNEVDARFFSEVPENCAGPIVV